jgi:hypothetical protein
MEPQSTIRIANFSMESAKCSRVLQGHAAVPQQSKGQVDFIRGVQVEVAEMLTALRVPFWQEHIVEGGLHAVDFYVRGPQGQRIAVEVDGPSHFSRLPPHAATGETLARDRMLRCLGWTVLSVSWMRWELLGGQEEQRVWLARQLLRAANGHTLHAETPSAVLSGKADCSSVATAPSCRSALEEAGEWWSKGLLDRFGP